MEKDKIGINSNNLSKFQRRVQNELIRKINLSTLDISADEKVVGVFYNAKKFDFVMGMLMICFIPFYTWMMSYFIVSNSSVYRDIIIYYSILPILVAFPFFFYRIYFRLYHFDLYILTDKAIHLYNLDQIRGGFSQNDIIYYDELDGVLVSRAKTPLEKGSGKIRLIIPEKYDRGLYLKVSRNFDEFIQTFFSILRTYNKLEEVLRYDPQVDSKHKKANSSNKQNMTKDSIVQYNAEQILLKDDQNTFITSKQKSKTKRISMNIVILIPLYSIIALIYNYTFEKYYIDHPVEFIVFGIAAALILLTILIAQIIEIIALSNHSNKNGSKIAVYENYMEIRYENPKNNIKIPFEKNMNCILCNATMVYPTPDNNFNRIKISYRNLNEKYVISNINSIFDVYNVLMLKFSRFLVDKDYFYTMKQLNQFFEISVFRDPLEENSKRFALIKTEFEDFIKIIKLKLKNREFDEAEGALQNKLAEKREKLYSDQVDILNGIINKIELLKRARFLFDIQESIRLEDLSKKMSLGKGDIAKLIIENQDLLNGFEIQGDFLIKKSDDSIMEFSGLLDRQFSEWQSNIEMKNTKKL